MNSISPENAQTLPELDPRALSTWQPASAASARLPVIVVIPTYNERENIQTLIPELLALAPEVSVLIVDDNSPDGTGNVIDRLASRFRGRVFALHRAAKQGIGPAYVAGFRAALQHDTPLVAQMDADRSHGPHDLLRLIDMTQSADLVLGSRYVPGGSTEGWSVFRRALSRFGGRYARAILGIPVSDLTGGFKVYRREILETIDLESIKSDGYAFQIETTYRAVARGFSTIEVPIKFIDRVAGKSKLSRTIVLEAIYVVWRLRFDRSIKQRVESPF